MPLVKNKFSIKIWMKNIDKILFKFKDFELVLYKIFKERVLEMSKSMTVMVLFSIVVIFLTILYSRLNKDL